MTTEEAKEILTSQQGNVSLSTEDKEKAKLAIKIIAGLFTRIPYE